MSYDLNLARRPFVNTLIPTAIALLVAAGIALFTAFNALTLLAEPEDVGAEGYQARIAEVMTTLDRMEEEISETRRLLSSDDARMLNERITFANELIAWKKLNWTRLFDRLEELTPSTVRMIQISPSVKGDQVALMLRIEESEQEAALEFVRALESSQYFGDVSIEDEAPSAEEAGQIWRLRVSYSNR